MKINYQIMCARELEKIKSTGRAAKLMLHSCCGPCSTYVLEYLSEYFEIVLFYYNPNIFPEGEYIKRLENQRKVIDSMCFKHPVSLFSLPYNHEEFSECARGFENEREGGKRCEKCFRLRLDKTAREAKHQNCDYFTTTLSVSPHKNAELLNGIGSEMSEKYGVGYLYADFKKREGYKRSIELSKEFDLYRQVYCGCEFSITQA